ncbi:hypothetical protein TRVL_08595 [Trypanosoma vivax]|nr:hypothetical protein TRVL_08595 [Trypanosoma vivax]
MKHAFVDSRLLLLLCCAACFLHLFLGERCGHRIITLGRNCSRAQRLATILRCGLHMLHGVLAANCPCDAARCVCRFIRRDESLFARREAVPEFARLRCVTLA